MADQARTAVNSSSPQPVETPAGTPGEGYRLPPRGVPVFTGINRIGLWSLYIKEVRRFLKVQTQTIWAMGEIAWPARPCG